MNSYFLINNAREYEKKNVFVLSINFIIIKKFNVQPINQNSKIMQKTSVAFVLNLFVIFFLFTSCNKKEIHQIEDLKRKELIQSFTESLSKTSLFLRENYTRENVGKISFFNTKHIQATTNAINNLSDNNSSLLDIQSEAYFVSLLESSTNLLEYEGIYDSLINEFGTQEPANIIVSAMAVVANEEIQSNYAVNQSYGLTSREVAGCLAEALTFGAAGIGIESWGFANLTVRGIVGIVAKVAARFVGPAFVAFALWDLADCLIHESAD